MLRTITRLAAVAVGAALAFSPITGGQETTTATGTGVMAGLRIGRP
ncbi:MAG: hypothetical protein H7066_16610 [Cytophagaceae bacterium]|nr:hypothetical protein [Gemmatimonadaceae bacterium]